jgi:hypothetical protein
MDFHAEIIIAPPIREKPLPGIRQGLVIMRLRFGNRRNFRNECGAQPACDRRKTVRDRPCLPRSDIPTGTMSSKF